MYTLRILLRSVRIHCALAMLWLPAAVGAQTPPDRAEITRSVSLGRTQPADSFSLRMVFPEYRTLSPRQVARLNLKPEEWPRQQTFSISHSTHRGQTTLTLSACPYVRQGSRALRQLIRYDIDTLRLQPDSRQWERWHSAPARTRAATAAPTTTTGAPAGRYAEQSVLATGRWVKIRVSEEGIYQLTSEWLRSAGFSDASRVKLYGYGGLMQDSILGDGMTDDLIEVPLFRRTGGELLFFAEGTRTLITDDEGRLERHVDNPYSSYSYYFLTEGDAPASWPAATPAVTQPADTVSSVKNYVIEEYDTYSWYSGGRQFYDSYNFATDGNSRTLRFNLPDFSSACSDERPAISMAAGGTQACQVIITLDGQQAGSLSIPALPDQYTLAVERGRQLSASPTSGSVSLNIRTTAGIEARLNYVRIPYLRTLSAANGPVVFRMPATTDGRPRCYRVSNATSATRLWHLSAGGQAAEVNGTLNGSSLFATLPAEGGRYVALDTEADYATPEYVGEVTNQNLHGDSQPYDMVIIIPTSGQLREQAERLADFHSRHDALRVKVVTAGEIYNEFSSGTPDATAYRRYLKMLYDRAGSDADMPRYLLLFGDCVWDNRMLTEAWRDADPDDYLLAYESDYSLGSLRNYATDDYFGLLDDGEGADLRTESIDLGIGRFTVSTAEEAEIMVDKTIRYTENAQPANWQNSICLMADDGDANLHMTDAESVESTNAELLSNFNVRKIYWDAYERTSTATGYTYPQARSELLSCLTESGALIMNYTGHGSPSQLSIEKVLTTSDFEYTTSRLPLWVMASCEIDPYDDPHDQNIGRTAVLNAQGGAIGMICAARTVSSDRNNYLNRLLTRALLTPVTEADSICPATLGHALMTAKNELITNGMDMTDNKLRYVLIGDPALRLNVPTWRVVIDSINNHPTNDTGDELIQLKAGQTATLVAHIETPDGQLVTDWNGTVSTTLFDVEQTITCRNNDNSASAPLSYNAWNKTLFNGTDSVRSGRIRTTLPIPIDISYSTAPARLVMYAAQAAGNRLAHGYTTQLSLNGTATDLVTDTAGPELYIYLNHPDFADGGQVGSNATFYATLADTSGINNTGNGVGHDIELSIDNDELTTYVLNNYFQYEFGSYTRGSITYPLSDLTPGSHTLTLRVWDLQNNPSEATLHFTVAKTWTPQLYATAHRNEGSNELTFEISLDGPLPENAVPYTVRVFDLRGRNLWNGSGTLQSGTTHDELRWNGSSPSGAPLLSGLYIYYVEAQADGQKLKSQADKIVVGRQ